jgi:hypothetical protein
LPEEIEEKYNEEKVVPLINGESLNGSESRE